METRPHVDTLSTAERISLRTNAVDWLLLVPNIGVEYDIKNLNWNRWSVGINLRYKPSSHHTFKPGIVFNIAEARVEVRNYYRIRVFDNRNIVPHKHIWDRLLSPRRAESHHPAITYYRGAFLAYNNYSIKIGQEGKQGSAIVGGVMWGIIKPLYGFANGNSLDMELAAAVGVAVAKYDTYSHNREDDCYPVIGNKRTIMPVVNELRVGFVYRFGNYPITKKYRWRYDADEKYQQMYDSIISVRKTEQNNKIFMDSLDTRARKMFQEKYDSLAIINKAKNDSVKLAEGIKKTQQKKESLAEKQIEKTLKAESKKRKNKKGEVHEETPHAEEPKEKPVAEEPEQKATTEQPEQEEGGGRQ